MRTAMLGLLALLLVTLAPATAHAGTTTVSSFHKSGQDEQTGSIGSSAGTAGTTGPGHTIDWTLSYRNTTGSTANVRITDPITGNQSYVAGSLKTAPGLDGRWSTNGGGSYAGSEPGSGVNGVGATGTNVDGSTGAEDLFSAPLQSFNAGAAAGDGWEAMFIGGNIYNVFHHRAGTLSTLDCHVKATGAECPGFPVQYVSPTAGVPFSDSSDAFGTGDNVLMTSTYNNGAYDPATGQIWFATGVVGSTSIGVACANIFTMQSCGYTQLGSADAANAVYPGNAIYGLPGMAGGKQVGTKYYTLGSGVSGAPVYCFDTATHAACGGWPVAGVPSDPPYVPGTPDAINQSALESWGGYIFTNMLRTSGSRDLGCVLAATGAPCPGFPILAYASPGVDQTNLGMAPLLDTAGNVTGICAQNGTNVTGPFSCYSLAGAPLGAAPWGQMVPGATVGMLGLSSALKIGARLYFAYNTRGPDAATYTCYDFAASSPCPGFVPLSSGADVAPYTIRQDPQNPDCLWELGDAGRFEVFSATFGGSVGCKVGQTKVDLTPSAFYCDGKPGHVTGWKQLRVMGVGPSEYDAVSISITDDNGNPVSGWTGRIFPSSQVPVDISSIPYGGATTTLHVAVVISWGSHPAKTASALATFTGDAPQVCFKTTVGPTSCTQANAISNTSNAVTVGGNGVNDAPDGNDSGTATLFQPADPDPCHADVSIKKTGSVRTLPGPGGQVMYTLVVGNTGPSTATAVKVSDDLPTGLTLVSAKSSQGSCADSTVVDCSLGDLRAGGEAQVLVTATVNAAASGSIKNCSTVTTTKNDTNPSNNSSCVTIPPSPTPPPPTKWDLQIVKKAKPTSVYVGQRVTYTLVVTNNGPDTATGVKVTDTFNRSGSFVSVKTTQGSCTKSSPTTCSLGTIKAKKKVTITVVIKPRTSGCKQRNAGSVTGVGTDSNPANNLSRADICAKPVPLRLTKVADRHTLRAGDLVGYTIRVSNPTAGEARNVKVCDDLPSGLVYVSSKAKAKFTKGQYCWTIKTLGTHKSTSFRITVRAVSSSAGNRVNRASASAPGAKSRRANDAVHVLPARASGGGVTG
jgi:uncharacterized repeat protein (TIGR01451 family)